MSDGIGVTGNSRRTHAATLLRLTAAMLALVSCTLSTALQAQPAYSAAFVSQKVPSFIEVQTPASVSVTMQNAGTATWYSTEGDVFLATQEPEDNYYWCIQDNPYGSHSGNRVLLPYDVAPNQQVTFNFVVNPLGCRFAAPSPLRFRMLSQLHGTFGEETFDPKVLVIIDGVNVAARPQTLAEAGGICVAEQAVLRRFLCVDRIQRRGLNRSRVFQVVAGPALAIRLRDPVMFGNSADYYAAARS